MSNIYTVVLPDPNVDVLGEEAPYQGQITANDYDIPYGGPDAVQPVDADTPAEVEGAIAAYMMQACNDYPFRAPGSNPVVRLALLGT